MPNDLIVKISNARVGEADYLFWCPACKNCHGIWIPKEGYNGPTWDYTPSSRPTVRPSVLVRQPSPRGIDVCHLFITDGQIQYLADSTHALAGKTVPMESIS